MQKIFKIDLDIKNPQLKSVPPIEVVSGDTSTNIFNINLLEDFKEVNATGNTAVITFVKSDGTTVFQNLTAVNASKGQYTCTLSSQTIVVPGRVKAEVSLYEGTKRLTSVRFEFNVRKALLSDSTAESSNEFSALTEALAEVEGMKDEVLNNLNTASLSLSNTDSIKSITAKVADVPKVEVVAPDIRQNLLPDGGEDKSKWQITSNVLEDTAQKMFGSKSFKCAANASASAYVALDMFDSGTNYYFASMYAYVTVNDTANISISISEKGGWSPPSYGVKLADKTKLNTWQRIGVKFSAIDGFRILYGRASSGLTEAYIDGLIVEKISQEDYNNKTDEQLLLNLPYINSAQPLLNLCVTVRGNNLTKGFAKPWGYALANGAYPVNADRYISTEKFKIKPNAHYVLSTPDILGNGATFLLFWKAGIFVGYNSMGANFTGSYSFTKDADEMVVSTGNTAAPAPSFSLRIQIEEGTVATPYEPYREKQRIYPCTLGKVGNFADKIEDDGIEVRKTWRVKNVILDGALDWTLGLPRTGFKALNCTIYNALGINKAIVLKFDGKRLTFDSGASNGDTFIDYGSNHASAPNRFLISAFNSDSGWGDNYAPTVVEIKAYFNGWKMNNGTFGTPYDGTGTKTWTKWNAISNTGSVTVVPTTMADGFTPYQLWYVLAQEEQEIIEPIGSLKLEQGYNCIDVASGIVYERANPQLYSTTYVINFTTVPGSLLSKKTKRIVSILKNDVEDIKKWSILINTAYGNERASIAIADFDPTANYTVLYEVLHEDYDSQQVSVIMEYADNLRTSHNQLVENVAGLESEVNDVWFSLLPIADKEIAMQKIALLTTETTADLKSKVNEILNVWR